MAAITHQSGIHEDDMAKTLHADLLTAQTTGYPTGSYAPAIRCIFRSKDYSVAHDYSFDPTVTTNRLEHVEQRQERENDSGVILLSNHDKTIPAITGFSVDLGWGHNTASGVLYDETDGAVSPRLWVTLQSDISGSLKGGRPQLYTLFQLQGVWASVLNKQPVRLASIPITTPLSYRYDDDNTIEDLQDKTIYACLDYLIGTALMAQTGLAFSLDDLGDQDDGQISSIIPFPSTGELIRFVNADSPYYLQTYGDLIRSLLELTKCILIPRAGLTFKILYPQESDTADETYYSSNALGHPFYEVEHRRLNMTPNHIQIFGGEDVDTGLPTVSGHWFDPDHYTTAPTSFTPEAIEDAYTGEFMPATASGSEGNLIWETGLDTETECNNKAAELGWQIKDRMLGTRVTIPMDARVELYDRVQVEDSR